MQAPFTMTRLWSIKEIPFLSIHNHSVLWVTSKLPEAARQHILNISNPLLPNPTSSPYPNSHPQGFLTISLPLMSPTCNPSFPVCHSLPRFLQPGKRGFLPEANQMGKNAFESDLLPPQVRKAQRRLGNDPQFGQKGSAERVTGRKTRGSLSDRRK